MKLADKSIPPSRRHLEHLAVASPRSRRTHGGATAARAGLAVAALASAALGSCGGSSALSPSRAGAPAALAACSFALPPDLVAIATRGDIEAAGLRGSFEALDDLRTGRTRSSAHLGELELSEGFDGRFGWQRDPGGEVAILDSEDARQQRRLAAWLTRRGYFSADGTSYQELGVRTEDGRELVGLAAHPPDAAKVELWLDRARCELARTVHQEGAEQVVTTLSDYRQVAGVAVPFSISVARRDPRNGQRVRITQAEAVRELAADAFAAPATRNDDIHFSDGQRRVELPFELLNQHVYLDGAIDGHPVRLLLDTGGVNLVTVATAKRLGLPISGSLGGSGAGAGSVEVSFTRARTLTLGTLEQRQPRFFVFPMDELAEIEGEPIDGIIGFELFQRFAVTIDYPARRLVVTDADKLEVPSSAQRVPFTLVERIPVVAGEVDGLPARLSIDTGSRVSITATAPFARKHDLAARWSARFTAVTGWGVGGAVRSQPVRVPQVRLGPVVLRDVPGDLFVGDKGALIDTRFDANVGGGLLSRFAVTFDYAARVMYLVPGPQAEARGGYDRSGLFLRRRGDSVEVVSVVPGSGADRAGVREGDRVLAIDGVAIGARHLSQWRRELVEGAVGARRVLAIERAGEPGQRAQRLDATLVLTDLLP